MKTKTKKQKKRKTKKKRKLVRKPRTKKKQKRQKTIRKRKTTRKNKKAITKKKREVIEISLGLIGLIILTLMAIQDPTLLGLNKITGSSTLEIHNQTGAWNTITDNNYLDSEALFTNTLGAKTAYHFNGSNVKIITQKRNDFGIMNVNVDGTDYEIDLYSEESVYGHEHNFNLAEGYHEMIISVSGNKNNLSTDYYIVIDEVILIESTEDETIFKIIEEAPEEETNKTQEINETILEPVQSIPQNLVIFSQAEDLDFGGLWFRAENNKYSNNVSLISNYHNDSLEYEFIGRNVYLLTEKRDDFGVANITIDDKSYLVDFYSENSIKPYLVSIKNLADTQHELRIKLTNLKNAQSTDNYIAIDALLQSKIGDLSDYETIDISNIKINEITDVLYQETQEQRIEITNQMQETITPPTFIKINEPVKWTKTVQVQQTTNNLKIELPKETVNLTIKKKDQYDNEELVGEENIKIIDENKETKQITEFVKEKEINELERKINLKKTFDQDTRDLEQKKQTLKSELPITEFGTITGNLISDVLGFTILDETEQEIIEEVTELIIEEEITSDEELEIEYYTEAPIAIEQNISKYKKQITISSETHYENILAYTYVNDVSLNSIKIYRLNTTTGEKEQTELYNYLDTNNDSLIDYIEWIIPHLSNQTYEIEITILNVQSYPTVGGNWTVMFETSGTANLTIKASNGTTWSNVNETEDLKFLTLTCNNTEQETVWTDNDEVFVQDYACNETGYETSKVLTQGKHHLQFTFGDQVAYAHNSAGNPGIEFVSPTESDSATIATSYTTINVSITNADDLDEFTYEFNNTNYTFYDDSLVLIVNLNNESNLDENYGSSNLVYDSSLDQSNGTIAGHVVLTTDGYYGNALEFDGDDDRVSFGDASKLDLDVFTISAWVNTGSNTEYGFIAGKFGNEGDSCAEGYGITLNHSNFLMNLDPVNCGNTYTLNGGITVPLNTWVHVVGTYDGTTGSIYVDGVFDVSDTNAKGNYDDFTIGSKYNEYSGGEWQSDFNGTIDEVMVWNRTLTANEISQLYKSNLRKYDIDKYLFQANQTDLTDLSSYSIQGTSIDTAGGSNQTEVRTITYNSPPITSFVDPTEASGTTLSNTFTTINVSITNADDLSEFTYEFNNSNYTFYNDSLVLMMNFDNVANLDENYGPSVLVYDAAQGNKNNGTMGGIDISPVTGRHVGALDFAGNGEHINVSHSSSINFQNTESFVMMAWIKNKETDSDPQFIFNKYAESGDSQGYQLSLRGSTKYLDCIIRTDGANTRRRLGDTALNDDKWHHVACVYNGDNNFPNLYLDGELEDATTEGSGISSITNTDSLKIGARQDMGKFWNGTIDEVRIYNGSLSANAIKQIYVSNIRKYDTDKYLFYANQTGLTDESSYTIAGYATDTSSNTNTTGTRSITYDDLPIGTTFVSPTEADSTTISTSYTEVNISITNADDLDTFTYEFNNTNYTFYDDSLVTMFNFDNVAALDENYGPSVLVYDSGSDQSNGTMSGMGIYATTGMYGGALHFDGTADYIDIVNTATVLQSTTTGTWEAWVNPENGATGANQHIIMFGNTASNHQVRAFIDKKGNLTVVVAVSGSTKWNIVTQEKVFNDDTWTHIAVVQDGANPVVYVDAVKVPQTYNSEVDKTAWFHSTTYNTGSIARFYNSAATFQYFNGTIDEVRIYNKSFSADEISQHYKSNLRKYDTDKYIFYANQTDLTDGSSYTIQGTAIDTSSNSNQTEVRTITYNSAADDPGTIFVDPTESDSATITNSFTEVNISITNADDLDTFTYEFNNSNYTFYNSSLILGYNFDNVANLDENYGPSTLVYDVSSESKNNGTMTGIEISATTGRYSGGMDLSGIDGYILVGDGPLEGATDFTLSAWIYPKSYPGGANERDIIRKWKSGQQSYYFSHQASGEIRLAVREDGSTSNTFTTTTTPISALNKWYHVVGVFDGGNSMSIYVDGELEASTSSSIPAFVMDTTESLSIGAKHNAGSPEQFFNGSIDELRIYNRSLSPDQIKQHYLSNLRKYDTDKYIFYANQTGLTDGTSYTIQGTSIDTNSNSNQTEVRTIIYNSAINDPATSFVSPTEANGTTITNSFTEVNISITNADDLSEFTYEFNNSNYTFYNDSLVMLLNMDNNALLGDASNRMVDSSGQSNGTVSGSQWSTSGRYGGAMYYDGSGETTFGNPSNLNIAGGPFTISLWVKKTAIDRTEHLFSAQGTSSDKDFRVWVDTNDRILCDYEVGNAGSKYSLSATDSLKINTWHHVVWVVTHNASHTAILYLDGVQVDADNHAYSPASLNQNKEISDYQSSSPLLGYIDELMVWKRALSPEEAKQLYKSNMKRTDIDKWEFYANQTGLTQGNSYSFQGTSIDTDGNDNQTEVRTITYAGNTAPPAPILSDPLSGNTTTVRTLRLLWNNATDTDGESVNYTLHINSSSGIIVETNISEIPNRTAYLLSDLELETDIEYYWKVRAYDDEEYGAWSETWNFTIESELLVSLATPTIEFGNMLPGETANSSTDNSPIIIQNAGNILMNISITGASIWSTQPNPTNYYRYWLESNETNTCDMLNTTDRQMQTSSSDIDIRNLNYSDTADDARLHIYLEVPDGEPSGAKNSGITITATG